MGAAVGDVAGAGARMKLVLDTKPDSGYRDELARRYHFPSHYKRTRRHLSYYFDLHQSERNAVDRLLRKRREHVLAQDKRVRGFNLGANIGELPAKPFFTCIST